MDNILTALIMTTLAGLCTGIGGLITIFTKRSNKNFLSISLGFSAGVMIYVSFMEILPKAQESLIGSLGEKVGNWSAIGVFFLTIIFIAFIDNIIPEHANPHEVRTQEEINKAPINLMRMGIISIIAISTHNFAEGIATFIAALQDPSIAIPVIVAIAMHNIPEGIAVAAPIYHATGSKAKAFFYALLSGLSEPLGAILAWLVFMPFINDTMFGFVFASVAGIMVFISLDELLPTARAYGKHHLAIYGLIAGMALMAVSLLMFE